jgi:hypothetical protein
VAVPLSVGDSVGDRLARSFARHPGNVRQPALVMGILLLSGNLPFYILIGKSVPVAGFFSFILLRICVVSSVNAGVEDRGTMKSVIESTEDSVNQTVVTVVSLMLHRLIPM